MMEVVAIVQKWLMMGCFAVLAAIGLLGLRRAFKEFAWLIARTFSRGMIKGTLATAGIVFMVLVGGSKSSFWFDAGLTNNGSYATNDTVYAAWTYSGIPSKSAVFIDYREHGSTNKWENLAETTAAAGSWTGTLANATNYDYYVYSVYVPPIPVHTNGVWVGQVYETKARVGAKSFLIINGILVEHGKTVAPPAAKRKEEQ